MRLDDTFSSDLEKNPVIRRFKMADFLDPSITEKNTLRMPGLSQSYPEPPEKSLVDFVRFLKVKGITLGKMLDLGCGQGRNAIYFAKRGFFVYGIDMSKKAVIKANELAGKLRLAKRTNFMVGNIVSLPYKAGVFDLAIDITTFQYLKKEEQEKYVEEVVRVLKPVAYYFLSAFSYRFIKEFSVQHPAMYLQWIRKRREIEPHTYWIKGAKLAVHFFTLRELLDFFGDYFQILSQSEKRVQAGGHWVWNVIARLRT